MIVRVVAALLLVAACDEKARAPETSTERTPVNQPETEIDQLDRANKLEAEIDQLDREITALKQKLEAATDPAQLTAYQKQVDALMVRYEDVVRRVAALRGSSSVTP